MTLNVLKGRKTEIKPNQKPWPSDKRRWFFISLNGFLRCSRNGSDITESHILLRDIQKVFSSSFRFRTPTWLGETK